MNFLLKDLAWMDNNSTKTSDLLILQGKIAQIAPSISSSNSDLIILNLKGFAIYPGLINSHDHLEMNLYPRLGTPPYSNYIQWGKDILKPHASPIKEIERISLKDRLWWGAYKNILSGVTTVVHHNEFYDEIFSSNFPISVYRNYTWAHSVAFEKHLLKKYTKEKSFIIHAAEGVDDIAKSEINTLNRLDILKHNTILIHGVGMTQHEIDLLSQSKSSLVWCPGSNIFLFNQTAKIKEMTNKIPVMLGTDSTLTGSSTLFDEMRCAVNTGIVSFSEVVQMATDVPYRVFNMHHGIYQGSTADLLILPIRFDDLYENLAQTSSSDIILLLKAGKPILIDASLEQNFPFKSNVRINGSKKWIIGEPLELKNRIQKNVNPGFFDKTPLWDSISSI